MAEEGGSVNELIQIEVRGEQAQQALDKILQAIQKVEQAVVSLGPKFDASMGRLIEPINQLKHSVDALNQSISATQRNLGQTAGMEAQGQAAKSLAVDYRNLRSAMAQFRQRGGSFQDPTTGKFMNREQLVERYMGGQYQGLGYGPGVGPAAAGVGYQPPTMQMGMGPSARNAQQLAALRTQQASRMQAAGAPPGDIPPVAPGAGGAAAARVPTPPPKTAAKSSYLMRYLGRYLMRYFLIWQTFRMVKTSIRSFIQVHEEMDTALADFSMRISDTEADVEGYRRRLREISMTTGVGITKIASPLAGTATTAELMQATEASKLFGGSVEDWLRTLGRGNVELDALAYGLRESTLATEEYAKMVEEAEDIGQNFNISTSEAIGMLSALPSVLKGDAKDVQALTSALSGLYDQNQLLLTLGAGPAVTMGPSGAQRRPMTEMMAGIGDLPIAQQRQVAGAIGLTSDAQQQLFLDAVAGWAQVQQGIEETVGAAGDFNEMLATTDESLKSHTDAMKASWMGLLETLGDTGVLKDIVDLLGMIAQGWQMIIEEAGKLGDINTMALAMLPGGSMVQAGMGDAKSMLDIYRENESQRKAALRGGPAAAAAPTPTERALGAGAGAAGPSQWQNFQVMRLQEGQTLQQVTDEMERVIADEFLQPFQTAAGEWIQMTREQIDAERQLTMVLDENGKAVGILNRYGPAASQAMKNLSDEIKQSSVFNLDRLRDISPEQFDNAMRSALPMWEARLSAMAPAGFEEEKELMNFFVGQNDVLRQQYATQTAMKYTLQDILDVEKKQLEGMWNIPTGVTMRVPLQSLDLMRWMQQGKGAGAGGAMPTELMPKAPTAADVEGVATAATVAARRVTQQVPKTPSGVPVHPDVVHGLTPPGGPPSWEQPAGRPTDHGRRGRVDPAPWDRTPKSQPDRWQTAQIIIRLVNDMLLHLDGDVVARKTEEKQVRQIVNVSRGRFTGGMRR